MKFASTGAEPPNESNNDCTGNVNPATQLSLLPLLAMLGSRGNRKVVSCQELQIEVRYEGTVGHHLVCKPL